MNTFTSLVRLAAAIVLALTAIVGFSRDAFATPPPAMPWEHTVSANTDPRLGLVAVDGPTEDQKFIAQCSLGGVLYQAHTIRVRPYILVSAIDRAVECRPGAQQSDTATLSAEAAPRPIITDPLEDWMIKPGPEYGMKTGWKCAAPGIGVAFNMLDDEPNWEVFKGEPECRVDQGA